MKASLHLIRDVAVRISEATNVRDLTARPSVETFPIAKALLLSFDYDQARLLLDVKEALEQVYSFPLNEQDRAVAIIQHPKVEEWILEPDFGALLVNANGRRHEKISPASVTSAMIVHVLSNTFSTRSSPFITLYWFCGSHTHGPNDNMVGLLRSFICQILSAGVLTDDLKPNLDFDKNNVDDLFGRFKGILHLLPTNIAIVCIIDGISWYEDASMCDQTCKVMRKLVNLNREHAVVFKLLMTSPMRARRIPEEPRTKKHLTVVEIPQHVDGAKQGFNQSVIIKSTKQKIRELSENLPERKDFY